VERIGSRLDRRPAIPWSASAAPAGDLVGGLVGGLVERSAGTGDDALVLELLSAQRIVTRDWLTAVNEEIGDRGGDLWAASWELLAVLDEQPDSLDVFLGHPYTRSWVSSCSDAVEGLGSGAPAEARHLTALAASAALRAGIPRALPVPVDAHGVMYLPTFGRARFRTARGPLAEVTAEAAGFVARLGHEELHVVADGPADERWWPVRRLTARGPGAEVVDLALEDVDPYRDCYPRPADARLSDQRTERLRSGFTAAWRLLRTTAPDRAADLRAGLSTVTPLVAGPGRAFAGSLAGGRRGMGAVGLAPGDDPASLARELLSGFQYAKLDALLEQCELCDEDDPRSFPLPWGGNPVPAQELLARAYARSATTGFATDPGRHAEDTARALDALVSSGALTPLGERFATLVQDAAWAEA
jgi:uncharacterized protein